jgi:hypothetical protein
MLEEWKDVLGYENRYKISNTGDVYSLLSKKILEPGLGTNGYKLVILRKNGKSKTKYIHVELAKVFLGARPTGYVINHIDANKRNNKVTNLEYVTQKQNLDHSEKLGRLNRRDNGSTKINFERAREIKELYAAGGITHRELGEQFGLARNTITQIMNDYIWRE